MKTPNKTKQKYAARVSLTAVWTLVLLLAFLAFFAAKWYRDTYGNLGFDSILYTLLSDLGGVETELILNFCRKALVPAVAGTVVSCGFSFCMWKKKLCVRGKQIFPFSNGVASLLCMLLTVGLLAGGAVTSGLHLYVYDLFHESAIFEEAYVDPNAVEITFPEKKRNLIYIFLESMETTYFSEEQGGALEVNLIPELYALAEENVNFSQHEDVGGFRPVSGTTWTIGAMVGQTAGVPLKTPPGVSENDYGQADEGFLPGITSITDILDDAGYYQTLMVGSVASFGGRRQYYTQHGADYIYDLSTARKDGIVPRDYFVWWGMEDKYLFEYAKQELTEISAQEEPFSFTLLTVDTHHIGGYVCEYCGEEHDE